MNAIDDRGLVVIVFLYTVLACDMNNDAFTGSGVSSDAPEVSYFIGMGEDCCGEDPHPVHGVETNDGAIVLAGKYMDGSGFPNGFVVKLDRGQTTGTAMIDQDSRAYLWSTSIGEQDSFDVINSVASIEESVFVVGARTSNVGIIQQLFAKLDTDTGEIIWESILPTVEGKESAFETIIATSHGGLALAGFTDGEQGGIEGFKSYGNPYSGIGTVLYFDSDQLSSNRSPDEASWVEQYPEIGSIRSIKQTTNGYVFVAAKSESVYTLVRTNEYGEVAWSTDLIDHGEATDVAVITDEQDVIGYMIVGHVHREGGIDGSITSIGTDGSVKWSKTYGNPSGGVGPFEGLDEGNSSLIFDECWAIQATGDGGAVIACGTGIEDCSITNAGLGFECRNDPRRMWRSLLIKVNENGEQIWFRTDSFYHGGDMNGEAAATAAEHVFRLQDGGYAAVLDQDFGIGLMVLDTD